MSSSDTLLGHSCQKTLIRQLSSLLGARLAVRFGRSRVKTEENHGSTLGKNRSGMGSTAAVRGGDHCSRAEPYSLDVGVPITPPVKPALHVTVLGVKATGRKPDLDEILRVEPQERISAPLEELKWCILLLYCTPHKTSAQGWLTC